jgi:hypothetical protein
MTSRSFDTGSVSVAYVLTNSSGCRVKEEVLDIAPTLPSEPYGQLSLYVEHSEADICLNTDRKGLLGILPTPPNDFESRAQR